MSGARISSISPDSPASGVDLAVGDELVSVNGREPTDIIEYQQLIDGDVGHARRAPRGRGAVAQGDGLKERGPTARTEHRLRGL